MPLLIKRNFALELWGIKTMKSFNFLFILLMIVFTSCKKDTNNNNSGGNNNTLWTQQGNKLVGSGAVGSSRQGVSVSLNSDGNTVLFSGDLDNNHLGAAWVFTRNNGTWAQQGNKLAGSNNIGNSFQESVAISADGNTAIIGGSNDNGTKGAAWIFTRNNGIWTEQAKLTGNGGVSGDFFGTDVSLSSDGNTAVISGYNGANLGAAWVFVRNNGTWSQQGNKLIGAGASGNSNQGIVAVSGDGNTFILGGFTDNNDAGAAWIFTRANGVWTQQGNKLIGTGAVGNANQGQSVAISTDGNTVVVGGSGDNNTAGAAWVFTRSNGTWTQQGSKLVGTGATGNAFQGKSVSISGDGNTIVLGGYNDNGYKGAVWVFTRSSGTWTQQGDKITSTGSVGNAGFGQSVAVNATANTIAAGGFNDDGQKGSVWIFSKQ